MEAIEPAGFAWSSIVKVNFVIAGILKGLIFRYGGRKLYNDVRPLILGLIMGSIMNMIGIAMAL